ncbi:nucleotidyl transferase AbiEii/AbiGii toxin family protein [Acidobacteria bacterium AH-259-O06]|nr:nucleotidyl transferase AbiEii/AbiGii toxin family protein [Acidobacteria bacterium AH-259-O06]
MALSAWGVVRATKDIDLLLKVEDRQHLQKFLDFLSGRPVEFEFLSSSPDDPVPLLIRVQVETRLPISIELLVSTTRWEAKMVDEAVEIRLEENLRLRVVKPEHLLLLKLRVGSPQDMLDAARLKEECERQPDYDWSDAERMAQEMGILEKLKKIY